MLGGIDFDYTPIDKDTYVPDSCDECGVDLNVEWHQNFCTVYADVAQDVAAGE